MFAVTTANNRKSPLTFYCRRDVASSDKGRKTYLWRYVFLPWSPPVKVHIRFYATFSKQLWQNEKDVSNHIRLFPWSLGYFIDGRKTYLTDTSFSMVIKETSVRIDKLTGYIRLFSYAGPGHAPEIDQSWQIADKDSSHSPDNAGATAA